MNENPCNSPEALHDAAMAGDLERVKELLACGAEVNSFDSIGYTALHYAAKDQNTALVRLLLEAGADPNAQDVRNIGNTPLGAVAGNCSLELARILVAAGADPTVPGWMQITALDQAQKRKRGDGPAVYQLLLEASRRTLPARRRHTH